MVKAASLLAVLREDSVRVVDKALARVAGLRVLGPR